MPSPAPPPPRQRAGARRVAIVAAAISICCAAVPVGLEAAGRSARAAARAGVGRAPEVVLARTDADVVRTWRSRGLRGRTVVHAGRYLHFVDEQGRLAVPTLTAPGAGAELDRLLEAKVEPTSYLWTAAALRVVRRLFYVSPPEALARRLGAIGVDASALPLRIDAEATPRTIDRAFPRLDEPVLLDVNASWFDEGDGPALLAALAASGLAVELATVSLAEDADDVSPAARDAARAFAAVLAGRPLEVLP